MQPFIWKSCMRYMGEHQEHRTSHRSTDWRPAELRSSDQSLLLSCTRQTELSVWLQREGNTERELCEHEAFPQTVCYYS
ncbi:hypothetical protein CesoFtcFv8_025095 [Champsocephalus esox]|uniref:Uncharacterized protein n=1 Tax=Champsocephalus esox TaxID=159716 RepID=A0AAN8B3T2_9TELE|nr:hypothetical protein CesoFtcFv8_025095 [Champsocephalus esox]